MTEEHTQALPKGFQLFEYRVESVLGHGGFGITYLAYDKNLNKEVAIKEYLPVEFAVRDGATSVRPRSTQDKEDYDWGLERFLKEAQTLAMFRHPSIVPVFRFFEAHGTAYMVMEYQKGDSLAALMKKHAGKFDEDDIRAIVLPILEGLAEVHKAGFLHRDVKPGNVYVREDGTPVLLDFGAARDAVGRKSKNLTSIVTPGYAPMEQYYTDGNQGPWTDIYSLGAILYQIVVGKMPPEAPARIKKDAMIPAIKAGKGKVSDEILIAIDHALAVDEEDRPQNVAEWRKMLTGESRAPKSHVSTRKVDSGSTRGVDVKRSGLPPLAWAGIGAAVLVVTFVAAAVIFVPDDGPGDFTISQRSVDENSPLGTVVGSIEGDSDKDVRYELVDNAGGRFAIVGRTLRVGRGRLDYESANSHSVTVRASVGDKSVTKSFTIAVQDVNEPPTNFVITNSSVKENSPNGTVVGRLGGVVDPDTGDKHSFTLENNAGGRFAISGDEVRVANGSRLDYERARQHAVVVRATDRGGLVLKKRLTIRLLDVNERPTTVARPNTNRPNTNRPNTSTGRGVRCPGSLSALYSHYAAADCPLVGNTFQQALTTAKTGSTSRWRSRGTGHSGTLTVIRTFRNAQGVFCRNFRQTVTANGRTKRASGVACQGRNNSWRIVG